METANTTKLREKAGDGTTDYVIEIRQSALLMLLDELKKADWYAAGCPPTDGQKLIYTQAEMEAEARRVLQLEADTEARRAAEAVR
jgi:hypothetical protein